MALGKGQCSWDVNASSYCIKIVFSNVKDLINHLTTILYRYWQTVRFLYLFSWYLKHVEYDF